MTHAKAQRRKGNAFAAKIIFTAAPLGFLAPSFMYSLRLCAFA
jgi:hypothetical protein